MNGKFLSTVGTCALLLSAIVWTSPTLARPGGGGFGGGGGMRPSMPQFSGSGGYRPMGGGPNFSRPSAPSRIAGGSGFATTLPSTISPRPNRPKVSQPIARNPNGGSAASKIASGNGARTRIDNRGDFLGLPATKGTIAGGAGNISRDRNPGTRPGGGNGIAKPGALPAANRPALSEKWQNVQNKNRGEWNKWSQQNGQAIDKFRQDRGQRWNQIDHNLRNKDWPRQFGSENYGRWRNDVRDYRRDRAREIWNNCIGWNGSFFDNYWWSNCPWIPSGSYYAPFPWWWWSHQFWNDSVAFFEASLPSYEIDYDPGVNVMYDDGDDLYYVNGDAVSSADDARASAQQLASPSLDSIPIPTPPAEGKKGDWLPMGAFALTQQESGDAVMFFQISINKQGIIGGAYKNMLSGDEQPIIGKLDKQTERVAWHVGNNTETIYETSLPNLSADVSSIFVNFGKSQTQTWLLVRLPSPDMPPGKIELPSERPPGKPQKTP